MSNSSFGAEFTRANNHEPPGVDIDDVVEVFLAISRDCIYFLGNPASHGGPDTVTIDWIANLFADDPDGLALAIEAWLIALEMGDP